jgi:hypothetical protein
MIVGLASEVGIITLRNFTRMEFRVENLYVGISREFYSREVHAFDENFKEKYMLKFLGNNSQVISLMIATLRPQVGGNYFMQMCFVRRRIVRLLRVWLGLAFRFCLRLFASFWWVA